jgi:riboflavin synthase
MFSGIVEKIGTIKNIESSQSGLRLSIAADTAAWFADVKIGDSIAVNGVCLTVVKLQANQFSVDVSDETLSCVAELKQNAAVNLEKALRVSDRLGGHLVAGHVDGVGQVTTYKQQGDCILLGIKVPAALTKYIAPKGSITVNGVSLTVNHVADAAFEVNLIPHTLSATNLQHLKLNDQVNLEIDIIARYVEKILSERA